MRKEFVKEARTWLGTRFHHQGRLKKTAADAGGCDCIGLIIGAMENCGILINGKNASFYDISGYPHMPDGKILQKKLSDLFAVIDIKDAQIGDIILFKFRKLPQHVAIISDISDDSIRIIHSYAQARKVVEHDLCSYWLQKIVSIHCLVS